MTEQEMIITVGLDNYLILLERHNRHQAGLEMARQVSHERTETWGVGAIGPDTTTRDRGDIPGCLSPWNAEALPSSVADTSTFLREMLKIEQEFMSGVRKR